jgi:hydroxymethylpyrimidine pyrophosphatase-like HAD family hydrolase
MAFQALATDFDGTLAARGRADDAAIAALERLRATGRWSILVTGRELEELEGVFRRLDVFDRVVAENGAIVYDPADRTRVSLSAPVPESFVEALRSRGVEPISVGEVVVATWEPHLAAVQDAIRATGLPLAVSRNKKAVMVLPTGIDKATGLARALEVLGLDFQDVVGIGDAENDLSFLARCGFSAAVANAIPAVKECVDLVTEGDHGAGVVELISKLLADYLRRDP